MKQVLHEINDQSTNVTDIILELKEDIKKNTSIINGIILVNFYIRIK